MEEKRLGRSPWDRFRADRRAMVCLYILCLEILAVLLLPPLLGLEPNASDLEAGFWAPPSAQHPLGTDDVGRDLLARLLAGIPLHWPELCRHQHRSGRASGLAGGLPPGSLGVLDHAVG